MEKTSPRSSDRAPGGTYCSRSEDNVASNKRILKLTSEGLAARLYVLSTSDDKDSEKVVEEIKAIKDRLISGVPNSDIVRIRG